MEAVEVLLQKVQQIALTTAAYIRDSGKKLEEKDIELKGLHDYVSYVDRESEKQLINGLKPLIPNAAFLVEEETVAHVQARYTWIIDPLDGTTNFLHGLSPHAISIALMENTVIQAALVLNIPDNTCFTAIKGSGARENGEIIQVSRKSKLSESLIATGFPFTEYGNLQAYMRCLENFIRQTRGVRRMGAAAIDLCYLASGRFDGFFEYNLKPWDVAAGSLIIQEAGGLVTDFSGGDQYLYGKEIMAANPSLFPEIASIVQKEFLT